MNNTDELDEFELAIREKLANYESTPPVGSWNAIVQHSTSESRKPRLVWINRSAFLLVLVTSFFTMWFAFGGVFFEYKGNETKHSTAMDEIEKSRISEVTTENENTLQTLSSSVEIVNEYNFKTENKTEDKKENTLNTKQDEPILLERTGVTPKQMENTLLVKPNLEKEAPLLISDLQYLSPKEINTANTELLVESPAFHPLEHKKIIPQGVNQSVYSLTAGLSLLYDRNIPIPNQLSPKLSNYHIHQEAAYIGVLSRHPLSKSVFIGWELKYQRLLQRVQYQEEIQYRYVKSDTVIVGYIQDPVTGRTPVFDVVNKEVNDIQKRKHHFQNELNALELPVEISWVFLHKKNMSLFLSAGVSYSMFWTNKFSVLNDEGYINKQEPIRMNTYGTFLSLETNYKLNTRFSVHVKPRYVLSNFDYFNNGFGAEVGVKYRVR